MVLAHRYRGLAGEIQQRLLSGSSALARSRKQKGERRIAKRRTTQSIFAANPRVWADTRSLVSLLTHSRMRTLATRVAERTTTYNPWMSRGAPTKTRGSRSRSAQAVVVALLVTGLLTAIFIFQNTARTRVRFLFWSTTAPLSGALILAAVLGGILAFLVVFVRQRRIARDSIAVRDEESQQGKSTKGDLSSGV